MYGWSHTHLEVDAAVAVLVEYPEDLVDEDGGVAGGQDHRVHVQHLRLVQDPVGAVSLGRGRKCQMRFDEYKVTK